jgi:molybdopterin-binding protein
MRTSARMIITVHAVENLGLKLGKQAFAVIKASSVMVGVE